MPSILFINRVYPPDDGATGRVLEHVARSFVRAGWEVSVLASACTGGPAGMAVRDGVKVIRCGPELSKRTLLSRALGYALMIPSMGWKALKLRGADVVVTKTDPPMLLILGPLLSLLKGSRTIHWAQDLYPEVAAELGVLPKGGVITGLLTLLSHAAMRLHDVTVAVGRCMEERLRKRGVPADRIRVILNTGIEGAIRPVDGKVNAFRAEHARPRDFVVEYSGNLGRAHEFDTILRAARLLQERGKEDILFLVIGGGPGAEGVRGEASRMGLRNVRFLPAQPGNLLSESLGAGDLHLVSMREGTCGLVVPSKFYGVLAAARPCLFVGPAGSEVALTIRDKALGEVIPPGSAELLMEAIIRYRNDPALCREAAARGGAFLETQDAAGDFVRVAEGLLPPHS